MSATPHSRSRIPGPIDPNAKTPLPEGVLCWVEARAETGYSNGDVITELTDLSGNGYPFTTLEGTSRWWENGGKPYVTGTQMRALIPAYGSNARTMVMAGTFPEASSPACSCGSTSVDATQWAVSRAQLFTWGGDPTFTSMATSPLVMIATYEAGVTRIYEGATLRLNYLRTLNTSQYAYLFRWSNNDRQSTAHVYAWATWPRVLTDTERQLAISHFGSLV